MEEVGRERESMINFETKGLVNSASADSASAATCDKAESKEECADVNSVNSNLNEKTTETNEKKPESTTPLSAEGGFCSPKSTNVSSSCSNQYDLAIQGEYPNNFFGLSEYEKDLQAPKSHESQGQVANAAEASSLAFLSPEGPSVESSSKEVYGSQVTLKRKSDSLALITSYNISSESDDEMQSAFLKPQTPVEIIDSESDSDTDTGSVFNIDSDASNESSQTSDDDNTTDPNNKKTKKSEAGAAARNPYSDLGDLPPIKDLQISVKEEECLPFGKVFSIVDSLVVIESLPDVPALNLDSVLFTKVGEPLGEVFDVFGPVKRPYYALRFKTRQDISEKSLAVGTVVYCAPKTKYTQYVFIHELAKLKGSDASWKKDREPPPECLDYSDDEQERLAKQAIREARMKAKAATVMDIDAPPRKAPTFEERMNQKNTLRNQMFIRNPPPESPSNDWFRTGKMPRGDVGNSRSSNSGNLWTSKFSPGFISRPPRSQFSQPIGGMRPNPMGVASCRGLPPRPDNPFLPSGPPPFSSGFMTQVPRPPPFSQQNTNMFPPSSFVPFSQPSPMFSCQNNSFQAVGSPFSPPGPAMRPIGSMPGCRGIPPRNETPFISSPPPQGGPQGFPQRPPIFQGFGPRSAPFPSPPRHGHPPPPQGHPPPPTHGLPPPPSQPFPPRQPFPSTNPFSSPNLFPPFSNNPQQFNQNMSFPQNMYPNGPPFPQYRR